MIIFAEFCDAVKILKLFVFLLLTNAGMSQPQDDLILVEDLQPRWNVFKDGAFEDFSLTKSDGTEIIYFELDPDRYQHHDLLHIQSVSAFSVYLNYNLLYFHSNDVRISLDSLKKVIATPWIFGVYQKRGLSWLKTEIVSKEQKLNELDNPLRPSNPFTDFAIIASFLLIIFFVSLLRTNPRLTADYFNFVRLFSIQEREDALLNSRVSSSVNMLYYGFSSLLAGLLLLAIFHFGSDQIPFAENFVINYAGDAFYQWIKLSLFIAILLILKLMLLWVLTRLFDVREATAIQFYNYIRLSLFIFVMAAVVCVCYFVFKIQNPEAYSFLLGAIIFLMIFWVILIGLKLLRRTSFRFFHLFSYLCASEIIPLVILVKVLNS